MEGKAVFSLHKLKEIAQTLKDMKKTMTGRVDMVDTLFYIKQLEAQLQEAKIEEE